MNYRSIYDQLINKAKNRKITGIYTESHHIVPRCHGGDNSKHNLVDLTAREHFIAHLLLAHIYGGSLWHAAHMMSNMRKYNSKDYAWLRERHSREMSKTLLGKKVTFETREKQRATFRRKKEERERLGIPHWHKGTKRTPEQIERQVIARRASGYVVSSEHRKKISEKLSGSNNPMWGKTHDETARKIISEANKQKVICPHCSKQGAIAIMQRWHFDRCRSAPEPVARVSYQKRTCPHCGKVGGGAQMTAHHFDNCKKKP